jgi:ABC-2 type transport system permease protein
MKGILNIFKKEVIEGIRNWVLLLLVIFPPIITAGIGGFLNNSFNVTIGVASNEIVNQRFYTDILKYSENLIKFENFESYEEAKKNVDSGKIDLALDLKDVAVNNKYEFYHGSNNSGAKIAISIIKNIIYADNLSNPIEFQEEKIDLPDKTQDYVAGLVIFSIIFITITHAITMICSERDKKTLDFLLTSPVSYLHVIIGKTLFVTIMSLISVFLTLAIAYLMNIFTDITIMFKVLPYVFFISIGFTAIGLIISAYSKNHQVASMISIFITMPLSAVALIPNDILNSAVVLVQNILPSRHSKDMVFSLIMNKPPQLGSIVYMTIFNILLILIATNALKKRLV